ncbi:MAG: hypothetical protein ABIQ15_00680 [Nocardioides sp.]
MTHAPALVVDPRFCGPRLSGNGGWTSGALAARLDGLAAPWPTVSVTLHAPPPLGVPLAVRVDGASVVLERDGARVATATAVDHVPTPVAAVPADVARAAEAAYPGLHHSPFPHCFVCGPARAEGDGLRIFTGPVRDDPAGSARMAATWTPHPSIAGEPGLADLPSTWAALDCAGGWAGGLAGRAMVLGRLTVRVGSLPVIGEEHVVVGEARERQGRKTLTATTLYDASGRPIACSEQIWIAVDPTHFEGPAAD